MVNYVDNNQKLFELYITRNGGSTFRSIKETFFQKVLWEVPELYTSDFDIVDSTFSVSGTMSVIEEWIKGNINIEPARLADMLYTILLRFSLQYGENNYTE